MAQPSFLEDSMYMQKMIGKEQTIRVILNRDENQNEELRTIYVKEIGFHTSFIIKTLILTALNVGFQNYRNSNIIASKIIWYVCGILTRVKEMWELTDLCQFKQSE